MGHTITTIILPRSYCQTFTENPMVEFCLSTGRCTFAFLKLKVPDFVSPTLWSPNSWDLNPDDYNVWSVGPVGLMQENVHRSRIAKVKYLKCVWSMSEDALTNRSWMLLPILCSMLCASFSLHKCSSSSSHFRLFISTRWQYRIRFTKLKIYVLQSFSEMKLIKDKSC